MFCSPNPKLEIFNEYTCFQVVEVDVMTMTIAVETETEVTTVGTTIELGTNSQVLPKLNIAICDLFCASDIK